MKKQSIIFGFSRYNDGDLDLKAREILGKMNGNANFPNPSPKLEDIQNRLGTYEKSLDALDGSALKRMLKDKERKALEKMLRHLGMYVLQVGEDDVAVLESSGFDLTANSADAAEREIEGFSVKLGDFSGTVKVKCNGIPYVRLYMFRYTEAPVSAESKWISVNGTRCSHLFEGLTPGKEYTFRIAVITRSGREIMTHEISRFAS